MLSADDIILVIETKEDFSRKLDSWREVLEKKNFKNSDTKTKYLIFNFSPKT